MGLYDDLCSNASLSPSRASASGAGSSSPVAVSLDSGGSAVDSVLRVAAGSDVVERRRLAIVAKAKATKRRNKIPKRTSEYTYMTTRTQSGLCVARTKKMNTTSTTRDKDATEMMTMRRMRSGFSVRRVFRKSDVELRSNKAKKSN